MAYMERIEPDRDGDLIVIDALRCYAAARRRDQPVLPSMVALASRNGLDAPAAVALASVLASVFELTEHCLGRRLACAAIGATLSEDEQAMLMLIAQGGAVGPFRGSAAIPHGLPGALVWAIRSADRLRLHGRGVASRYPLASPACPFAK